MVPRTLALAALLLAAPLLAGCLGGSGDDEVAPADEGGEDINTAPPEGRGPLVAFEETNATEEGSEGLDHHHDYWQGRDRVVIFQEEAFMTPMSANPLNSRAFQNYEASVTFRPPLIPESPALIFEGTERVEFTIENPRRHACGGEVQAGGHWICTSNFAGVDPVPDPNPTSPLTLRYKHAATMQWIDAGDITWGEPVAIRITNPVQTDMPHATKSLWEFQILSPNKHDSTLVFDVKAEIVRGGDDVPLWPGHPDFYANAPHRVVLNVDAENGENGYSGAGVPIRPPEAGPVYADRLISYGTRTLYVWVNVTEFQAPNPASAPSTWYLMHRNATGADNITNAFDFENYDIEKRELHWVLPVDDNGMDSPYADASRWNFELGAAYTPPEGPTIYRGFANWAAKYTLVIHASSIELAPEEYHLYCLDTESYCG